MPFAVMLMPGVASPPMQQIAEQAKIVMAGSAHPVGRNGAMQSSDGVTFSFNRDTIRLTRTSPKICTILFDLALKTNTYVATEGSGATPVKIAGSSAEIPKDLAPPTLAANPEALCQLLDRRLWAWTRIEKAERANGVIDSNGRLLEPPAAPGSEPRLAADPSGLAAQCQATASDMAARTGWRIATTTVTLNPKWGVVWRADVVTTEDARDMFRDICWRRTGIHPGLVMSTRPLQMFDPKVSVEPLNTENVTPAR